MKPLKFFSTPLKTIKKTKRYPAICLHLLAVIISVFYLTQSPAFADHHKSRDGKILISASELDYPPFSLITPDGKADGFSVDLLKATAKEIKREISFSVGPWHELKQNLADGKVDVLPLVGYTPERDKVFDFTVPYLRMHGAFFTRKGDTQIKSITDLKNKEVLVMRGDNAHEFLEKKKNIAVRLVLTDSYEEAFERLSKGKHDALFSQELVGLLLIKKLGINNLTSTQTLFPDFVQKFSFAVKDGDSHLLADLNEGLSLIVADGTYDRLYEKWFAAVTPKIIPMRTILKYVAMILLPIVIIIVFAFIIGLKREVIRKTRDLQNELSERKIAEEELKESEEKFRRFSDASLEGMVVSENGIMLEVNKRLAEMVCYDQKELLGKRATEVVPQECQKDVIEKILSDYDKPYETMLKRKDGSAFPVEICGKLIMFHGKKARVTSIRDLSERKRAEEEKERLISSLKQAQKMEAIGTLAGGIAHDFNNVLIPIIGYAELNLAKFPVNSKTYADLKQILDSGFRARDLVKQILTFSRQEEHMLTTVSLSPIVREALKFMRSSLPANIEIRQNLDDQSGTIQGDITQIHQIIMNLCTNAEYAMREKGGVLEVNLKSVRLDARFSAIHFRLKEGHYLKLTVSDKGHGMSKEIMDRIFDPFFTTKGVGEGTGMGLSTVHGLVLNHGGDIIVNSELGKGTNFDIYLPKSEDIEIEGKSRYITIPRGNERILFVDDEEGVAKFGQDMLESLGYEVITKTSSLEALDIFKKDPQNFDLVITDQTMPNITGEVLARKLMQIRSEIPVILCTGFSHTITVKEALAMGIREFIMKPFVITEVSNSVRKVLDQKTINK